MVGFRQPLRKVTPPPLLKKFRDFRTHGSKACEQVLSRGGGRGEGMGQGGEREPRRHPNVDEFLRPKSGRKIPIGWFSDDVNDSPEVNMAETDILMDVLRQLSTKLRFSLIGRAARGVK